MYLPPLPPPKKCVIVGSTFCGGGGSSSKYVTVYIAACVYITLYIAAHVSLGNNSGFQPVVRRPMEIPRLIFL